MRIRNVIGIVLIIFGLSALLGINLGRVIFPLILIGLGFFLLKGKLNIFNGGTVSSEEEAINEVTIFSDANRVVESNNFRGGRVVSVFADTDIDLNKVKTKQKEIKLELVSIFSDLNIKVPKGWTVNSSAVGILGDIKDPGASNNKGQIKLLVDGVAIFGTVTISN